MRKIIVMSVVLLCFILVAMTGVLYAKKFDDTHTNWKPFYHDGNVTLSYEYDDETGANVQRGAKLHVSKNLNGYIYFYVKKEATVLAKHLGSRWMPGDDKANLFQWEVLKACHYMVFLDKIDCKKEVLVEEEAYEDFGGYKMPFDLHNTPHGSFIKLDGQYSGIPFRTACESFSKTWKEEQENNDEFVRRELAREAAIAEQEAAEKARLEKQKADQDAGAQRQKDEHQKQLRQYGVQYVVNPIAIETDPFRFEGKVISCKLHFERMMSATTASFTSGYSDVADMTHVADQIIVSGIPRDTHFVANLWGGFYELVLRGKGTTTGTNAFGAKVSIPHFQYVGIIKK